VALKDERDDAAGGPVAVLSDDEVDLAGAVFLSAPSSPPWGRCMRMITLESCSIAEESLKSVTTGHATDELRLNWARATTGISNSIARSLSPRLMVATSVARVVVEVEPSGVMSWR
jgi:hypothetical protein